jgi:hypothetical protein
MWDTTRREAVFSALCGPYAALGGVLLATLLVYAPVIQHELVGFDDGRYLERVRDGLSLRGVGWAFTSLELSNWHPLTWLSLQLDVALFGTGPRGFHITNLILHLLTTAALFGALQSLTRRTWPSLVVAAAFALHPLHVESVAWMAERKDVLSGLFFALMLWAYARYAARETALRYAAVAVALSCGLMAKAMLVTAPAVLLLLDFWPLHRWREVGWRRCALEKVPLLVLCSGAAIVALIAQSHTAMPDLHVLPLHARFSNAGLSYWAYLRDTVLPVHLAIYYPHPGAGVPLLPGLLASLAILGVSASSEFPPGYGCSVDATRRCSWGGSGFWECCCPSSVSFRWAAKRAPIATCTSLWPACSSLSFGRPARWRDDLAFGAEYSYRRQLSASLCLECCRPNRSVTGATATRSFDMRSP